MMNNTEIGTDTSTPPAQNCAKYRFRFVLSTMLNSPSATVLSAEIPEDKISDA